VQLENLETMSVESIDGTTKTAMDAVLISVIIPCFNAGRYIETAIYSVLSQDWPAVEIIVVDDGSTDGSSQRVSARFHGVTLIRQKNQGVAAARNRGIAEASGEWIAFLDADDFWLPGKLSAQMNELRANPQARMAYSAWAVWVSDAAAPEADYVHELLSQADDARFWSGPSGWIYPQLLLDCAVWTSTVIANRSLLAEIGGFDPSLRIGEDYDLWLRASRVTPILRVPRPLALYRQHLGSITRSAPLENYRSIVISRALSKWGYRHSEATPVTPARVRRALAQSWSQFAVANLQAGQMDRARKGVVMSLRTDPAYVGAWKALIKTAWRTAMFSHKVRQ